MIQQKTKIVALVSGILIVLSSAAFFGFLYLVSKHEQTLQDELRAAAEAESRSNALDALIEVTEKTAEERKALAEVILKEENIIEFLSLIETVAREQGVTVKTNSLTPIPLSSDFDTLEIGFELKGDYATVLHVIRLLEMVPYQSTLTRVLLANLSDAENSVDSDVWQATVSMTVTKYRKQ